MSVVALLSREDGSDDVVDMATFRRSALGRNELLWVDVTGDDRGELEQLETALELEPDAESAISGRSGELGVRVLPGGFTEVVARPPGRGEDGTPAPIRILLGDGWVVTQHADPSATLEAYRERIQDGREVGRLTPVEFLTAVLDWYVDGFFHAAERLEQVVDRLDNAALAGDDDLLDDLVRARRRIARVRRVLVENREVFSELARPDFVARLPPHEVRALEHIGARLDRAGEAIGHVREMLVGTFDVHMTRTAQRTNDVMRVLTWASVILLPAVVVAGVMGMNFDVPLFEDANLFYVIVGAMAAIALGSLLVARWRRWL